jgi:hypothetical protein
MAVELVDCHRLVRTLFFEAAPKVRKIRFKGSATIRETTEREVNDELAGRKAPQTHSSRLNGQRCSFRD